MCCILPIIMTLQKYNDIKQKKNKKRNILFIILRLFSYDIFLKPRGGETYPDVV